jgi:hypothetical protein
MLRTPAPLLDCAANLVSVNGFYSTNREYGANALNIRSLEADIEFGTAKECQVIPQLKEYFKEPEMERSKDKYSPSDAYSPTTDYEIKSRRNAYSKYPTTIIGVNKIRAKKPDRKLVFVFHFTDGLYYIEYTEEVFSAFEVKNVKAIRRGGNQTETPHYFVPIESLTRIHI